jgi:hypothetical protein
MSIRSILPLVAAALLLAAPTSQARPEFAAHAGVNISTYHEDDLYSDAREGATVGVGAAFALSDEWKLVPEVWWGQRGFKQGTLWEQIGLDGRTQTITVPLTIQYWFPAESVDPRVFAGVSVDFLLKSEISELGSDEWIDVTDQDNSSYWSLVLGGGVRFMGWLDLDFRYYHAFTPVTNFDYEEFDDRIPVLNEFDDAFDRTWTLTLGVWF